MSAHIAAASVDFTVNYGAAVCAFRVPFIVKIVFDARERASIRLPCGDIRVDLCWMPVC